VDELCEAITSEKEDGAPPFVVEGDRAYARYPGFRSPLIGVPDRVYELVGEAVPGRLAKGTELLASAWEQKGDGLTYTVSVRVPVLGDVDGAALRLVQGAMPKSADKPGARRLPADHSLPEPTGRCTVEPAEDGGASVLHARVPLERRTGKLGVRVYVNVAGSTYEIPVRGKDKPMPLSRRWGRQEDPYRAAALVNDKGRVVVATAQMFPPKQSLASRVKAALARRLKPRSVGSKPNGAKKPNGSKRK
jgi:hypothetical protein